MSSTTEHPEQWPSDDFVPTEELARRQGVKPIESVDELAQPDLWESDEEYEAFLADPCASRRADLRAFFTSVVLPCGFQAAPYEARSRPTANPRASSPVNDSWIAACCVARICHLPRSTSRTSPSTRASNSSTTDALWNDSWNEHRRCRTHPRATACRHSCHMR